MTVTLPPESAGVRYESDAEEINALRVALGNGLVPPVGVDLGHVVHPIVVHGQWIGECPHCRSARLAHPDRLWWCAGCGAGLWRVEWPNDDATAAVSVLALRPMVNRNWYPQRETAIDLAIENLERGLTVPGLLAAAVDAHIEADWIRRGLADEMKGWVV